MTVLLDHDRVKQLFDLRSSFSAFIGGDYNDDPYVPWKALRDQAPVHPGTPHGLIGLEGTLYFHGLPEEGRQHFTVFSHAEADAIYRDPETYASAGVEIDFDSGPVHTLNSMLAMGGARHRRYRALVQPSFVPAKARWWIESWIEETVHQLIDAFIDAGRAELNVDFCAAIPVLTITGSFGIPVDKALDIRAALGNPEVIIDIVKPIIAARREQPEDDLISILVQAEIKDEDGNLQRLTDREIHSFVVLLLSAGSGTTWKQMGITLTALLTRPELLAAVQADRSLLKPVIEETLRWQPTDPMFSRWVTRDTVLGGVELPAGSVVHIVLGAANRDPARWDDPDTFDPTRAPKATLAFGGGQHICLGMHVARAEMTVGINAILDRLPGLRLDPEAETPRYIGFYERGSMEIPVLFDTATA